ncbi:ABC transporter substrate-binding protein [Streptomyces thermocarboxydus]
MKKPIGNGPYLVESYTRGSQMALRKWDDYPGDDKAENGGVDLKVYTDNNTAYTDLLVQPRPGRRRARSAAEEREERPGRPVPEHPRRIIQTLAFPFYDPAWNTEGAKKVRQGLSMAIDRKQITDTIFQKTRTPATDWTSPVLGEDGGFQDGLCGDFCEFKPDEAKKLIEEGGGLPGGKVTITFNADTGSHREWVNAVCNSINNALDNERACTANPVGTFADFRNQITDRKMTGPFRPAGRWTTRSSRTSSSRCTTPTPRPTTASGPTSSSTTW